MPWSSSSGRRAGVVCVVIRRDAPRASPLRSKGMFKETSRLVCLRARAARLILLDETLLEYCIHTLLFTAIFWYIYCCLFTRAIVSFI